MSLLDQAADVLDGPVASLSIAVIAGWLLIPFVMGPSLKSQPRLAWAAFWLRKAWLPLVFLSMALRSASAGDSAIAGGLIIAAALIGVGDTLAGKLGGMAQMVGGTVAALLLAWQIWQEGYRSQTIWLAVGIIAVLAVVRIVDRLRSTRDGGAPT